MSSRGVVVYCSREHTVFLLREGTEWGGHTRLTSPPLIRSCSLVPVSPRHPPLSMLPRLPPPPPICLSSLPLPSFSQKEIEEVLAAPPGSDLLLYQPPPSLIGVSAIASPVLLCTDHTLLCLSLVSITYLFSTWISRCCPESWRSRGRGSVGPAAFFFSSSSQMG